MMGDWKSSMLFLVQDIYFSFRLIYSECSFRYVNYEAFKTIYVRGTFLNQKQIINFHCFVYFIISNTAYVSFFSKESLLR